MCCNTNEIRSHIFRNYSIQYSRPGCIKLLHRLGFEYKKPRNIPSVADEAAQQAFIEMYQELQHHLPDGEAIYFADGVHPEHQSRPAHGWIRNGANVALKTSSKRKRVNIHGALNLETFDCPFVEAETLDETSAIQLLKKIEIRNPAKSTIHVIWDNAAYHRSAEVKKWLSRPDCRIHLILLPPYCPHLNPIERLWKVMHEWVTRNKFYPTFNQFARAILAFFRQTVPNKWKSFRDQVTDNFRIISHKDIRVLE